MQPNSSRNRIGLKLAEGRLHSLIQIGQNNLEALFDKDELTELVKSSASECASEKDLLRLKRSLANHELGEHYFRSYFWRQLPEKQQKQFMRDLFLLIERQARKQHHELH